jgi:hypothetical protein
VWGNGVRADGCRHCVALSASGRAFGWGWAQMAQLGTWWGGSRSHSSKMHVFVEQSEVAVEDGRRAVLLSKQPGHRVLFSGTSVVSALALPAACAVRAAETELGHLHDNQPCAVGAASGEVALHGRCMSHSECNDGNGDGPNDVSSLMVDDPVHGFCLPAPTEIILVTRQGSSRMPKRYKITSCVAQWWHTLMTFQI